MSINFDSERRWLYIAMAAVVIALMALAFKFARPAVPSTVTMSKGGAGGAYEAYAQRYAAALAEEGITLKLVPSKGAVENLQRLQDEKSGTDLAFVQNGLADRDKAEEGSLESLGSFFYEPVFVFYRPQATLPAITNIAQLKGMRIGIGSEGSGTQVLARALLSLNGVDANNAKFVAASNDEAATALREGSLDAIFVVANATAPLVQTLFRETSLRVADLEFSEAYSRRLGYVNPVIVERGVIDVPNQIPAQTVRTVATTTSLVARDDLHPAITFLLMRAAKKLHGVSNPISKPNEFPSFAMQQDFPHSADAERVLKEGVPFLYRHLPFKFANFISRAIVFAIPLLAILVSLSDWIPKIIAMRVKRKLYTHYKEMKRIDEAIRGADSIDALETAAQRLSELDATVGRLNIPNNYSNEQFGIRDHMDLVRVRVERKRETLQASLENGTP
ncbi:MAG: TAXI family TRAP transporter solute-binding subunit [Casimicrobium sp.]